MLSALEAAEVARQRSATGASARNAVMASSVLRALSGGLTMLVAMLLPHVGWAEEERPFSMGPKPVWYLLGGATTGGTMVAHDRGGYVGGEVSLVHLERGRFGGLYGDAYRDLGGGRTYTTAGIELGYKFLGIDGGAAARFGAERPEWGPTGRLFVGFGILSVYGRYAYFIDALGTNNAHVVQVGALVKIPIKVWGVE